MQMGQDLEMDRNHGRARRDERVQIPVRFLDHQVHIERNGRDLANRSHDWHTNHQVRDEMSVQHVDVNGAMRTVTG